MWIPRALSSAAAALASLALAAPAPAADSSTTAPFPITEEFTGTTMSPSWHAGGTNGNVARLTAPSIDADGSGWLRLTPAVNDRAGYVFYDDAFPSDRGIVAEFDYATYGHTHGTGADGIAFFLYDGATPASEFHPGGYGGNLGYADCPEIEYPGLSGGYVGVGLDEYGNFGNRSLCGRPAGDGFAPTDLAPFGQLPNNVTVRAGTPDYRYLGHSVLPLGRTIAASRADARRVLVTVTPDRRLSVFLRFADGEILTVVRGVELPADVPPTLKLGFVAGTGSENNNHEVRRVKVRLPGDLRTTVVADETRPERGLARTWTATVTNTSARNDVAGARVTGALATMTNVRWTCEAAAGASCGAPAGTGAPDTTVDLPAGAHATYRVTADEGPTTVDATLAMRASVDPAGAVADGDPTNDAASATVALAPVADRAPAIVLDGDRFVVTDPGAYRGAGDDGGEAAIRWQRCDADGGACVDIPGATGREYAPTAGDTGSTVRAVVRRSNDAGHVDAPSAAFVLPKTELGAAPRGLEPTGDATLTFTSDDPEATFTCRLDEGDWQPCASPLELAGLTDGEHRVAIRAARGPLVDATPATHVWHVDQTPPDRPALGDKPSPRTARDTAELTFTGEPGTTFRCEIDGGPAGACASPLVLRGLAEGRHEVRVTPVDPAGNLGPAVRHSWVVDRTPPPAPGVLGGPAATTTLTSGQFELLAESGATLECRVDGGAWTPCSGAVTLNRLAPGPHVFEARQTDGVGNVGPVAVHRWTVRVGAAAPGVPGAPAKAATPVVPTRTAVQEDGTAVVGCAVDQPTLRSCVVRLTHKGADGREVVVGQVTVQAATGRASVAAPVRLTAAGRRMLRVAGGGLPVTVAVDARVASGQVLRSVRRSVLTAPQRVLAPVVGPFVAGTARFDARIRADVRAAAALLRGARSVTCAGHTDSRGTDAFSRALGLRRAQAVCAALRDAGVRARTTAESAGEDRPRASNRTARGRALNRRVELTARF